MSESSKIWCDSDEHRLFEHFTDFNEWIDSSDGPAKAIRKKLGIYKLAKPSKAFFAGDREAYDQAFEEYRLQKRQEILSKQYFEDTFEESAHWFEKNESRFEQLLVKLSDDSIVPFIGAGVSNAGGFPTWKNHLRQQGKTAGIDAAIIEEHLSKGQYETIIAKIEQLHGPDVFTQEIRDVFSRNGSIQDITLRISELFQDTLITTNYDRLLEQVFDTGPADEVQVINGLKAMERPDPEKITVIKLHGDILSPQLCILSKNQYDQAYGEPDLDLTRPIPKALSYYYRNSSLIFIGCSLNNDRTVEVFKAVKETRGDRDTPQHFSIEQAPDTEDALIARNAELVSLGITPIWYPAGQYDLVEAILRHAQNELKHQLS